MKDITFNGIKQSLIEYYSSKEEFKDFNWTAPAITTLIDAQAYLAHYLCAYAGFALNESFLDSAQKRASVVSKAKNIGYRPTQYTGSMAKLKLEFVGGVAIDNYAIPVGTSFSATNNGKTFYFRTKEAVPVQKTPTGRYWAQVTVYEGTEVTNRWTQAPDMSTRFVLSNPVVDTSTIKVVVYNNSSDDVGTKYSELESLSQFDPDAAIYTVEENTNGDIELHFGDGILSKRIEPGNIVVCTYDTVSGSAANNIAAFQLISIPNGSYDVQLWRVTTLEMSNSGTERESIESIKLNAPRFFQRQGRNVIADDFKADLLKSYGGMIDAISVWGGENNTPPEYGTVFISIKPHDALALTITQKEEIRQHVLKTSVIGITPKIVDPVVLYVTMDISAHYNEVYSSFSTKDLKQKIIETSAAFFENTASSFNVDFRYSKFLSGIFSIDETITNTDVDITLKQYLFPSVDAKASYIIEFKNAIEPGTVNVGPFTMYGQTSSSIYMNDDGNGVLNINIDNISEEVGAVDYENGTISIKSYTFTTPVGEQIPITVKPANKNMSTTQNYTFSVEKIDVAINEKTK